MREPAPTTTRASRNPLAWVWPRSAILRQDPGLAASPPVRDILGLVGCVAVVKARSPDAAAYSVGDPEVTPEKHTAATRIEHHFRVVIVVRVSFFGSALTATCHGICHADLLSSVGQPFSAAHFFWALLVSKFLRPAPSRLLLLRFLPRNPWKPHRRLLVRLPKCSRF